MNAPACLGHETVACVATCTDCGQRGVHNWCRDEEGDLECRWCGASGPTPMQESDALIRAQAATRHLTGAKR